MKNSLKIAIFYIVLIGILIIATASLWDNIPEDKLVFSEVVEMFRNEQVRQFEVDEDNNLTMLVRVAMNDGTAGMSVEQFTQNTAEEFRAFYQYDLHAMASLPALSFDRNLQRAD